MLASARQGKSIEEVDGANKGEKHAGGEVMPTVREHSREEIFSQQCDAAEESSVDADENDAAHALVAVGSAEDDSGEQNADRKVAQQRDALRLEIAAKDELFGEADNEAEQAPGCNLNAVGRREFHELASHLRLLLLRGFLGRGTRCGAGLACGLMLVHLVLNHTPANGDGGQDDH